MAAPSFRLRLALASALTLGGALLVPSTTLALKYAPVEHHLQVDPSLPVWKPAPLEIKPEQEFHSVGADTMDQITLGWVELFREAYPPLSVTMEARASGSGIPALVAGTADVAPVAREALPGEYQAFVAKFGYPPFAVRVATGSMGSLGKTAATVILVDKDNPIKGLSLAQLDAIYSSTDKRGHAPIRTWGDLGLGGVWKDRPIHLYGLKPPNGIEQYVKGVVLEGGDYKDGIAFVNNEGFTHAFTVGARDMATHPGGLEYAMLANLTPNVRVVPLSINDGGPYYMPTIDNIYTHAYPLSRYVYIYVNRPPGKPLDPVTKQFLELVLSRQGQDVVAKEGVYVPLTPAVVKAELQKLQ